MSRWLRLEEILCHPQRGPAVAAALRTPAAVVLAPWIGPGMDRLLRLSLSAHQPMPTLATGGDIATVATRALRPVARGDCLPDPAAGGIVTRRWFILPQRDAPELIEITTRAWEGFEADTPGRPLGLWQDMAPTPDGAAQIMLLTCYPSLAAWESSRAFRPGAAQGPARRGEWAALFARRRALLLDSWVEVWGVAA
ncbi:MAG: hypothetical protein RMK64_03645 [Rhodovarius sp.]|nr:hypothetical protein [Rhodovarius sp.]MDW8314043.1 hypothetical protein [Rhodovarius sp.]